MQSRQSIASRQGELCCVLPLYHKSYRHAPPVAWFSPPKSGKLSDSYKRWVPQLHPPQQHIPLRSPPPAPCDHNICSALGVRTSAHSLSLSCQVQAEGCLASAFFCPLPYPRSSVEHAASVLCCCSLPMRWHRSHQWGWYTPPPPTTTTRSTEGSWNQHAAR